MTGVEERTTKSGIHVFRVHYTADAMKREEEVLDRLAIGMVGGRTGRSWRREMEIDWTVASGVGIYSTEFRREVHVSKKPFYPVETVPLHLMFDFGLTPACAWGFVTPTGRAMVFHEQVTWNGRNTIQTQGIEQLAEVVKLHKNRHYPKYVIEAIYADPAGNTRSQTDERTCFDALAKVFPGVPIIPGPVSSEARKKATREVLSGMVGGEPKFMVSPSCTMIVEALDGQYKWKQVGDDENRIIDQPDKNAWSHIMESVEYWLGSVFAFSQTDEKVSDEPEYAIEQNRVSKYY